MKQTNIVSSRVQAKASHSGGAFQLDGKKWKEPYPGPRNASTVVLGRRYFKSCPAGAEELGKEKNEPLQPTA